MDTYFFQVPGESSSSMGKISSLPASISNMITNLDKTENELKLPIGPTSSNPGPILFKVAAIAVKLLVKSRLSSDISKTEKANINIYDIKNTLVERNTSCSILFPLNFNILTLRLCIRKDNSLPNALNKIMIRDNLMLPQVLPAHAPVNIRRNRTVFEKVGQLLKSTVA